MGALLMAPAPEASAQVVVTVDGDTAHATISLTDDNNVTYEAEVTIVFDTPQNLTADSLNLTAELVDPGAVQGRLDQRGCPILNLVCVEVDPAFPMMITVEPTNFPWLFTSGFEENESGAGNLAFVNTYAFEVHTHDLGYQPGSKYRLFKAPLGGQFNDITDDVLSGSVRARGRHGAFSQFMVVYDPRAQGIVDIFGGGVVGVSGWKLLDLNVRILAAAINDLLRGDLLGLVAQINTLLVTGLIGPALDVLDELIADLEAHAGIDIPNVWRAERDVTNDAGEMLSLAYSLRFSIHQSQGTASP